MAFPFSLLQEGATEKPCSTLPARIREAVRCGLQKGVNNRFLFICCENRQKGGHAFSADFRKILLKKRGKVGIITL